MQPTDLFSALSDSTRLRCLALMLRGGELCVCDLTAILDLSQPKVSRHLAYLRAQGLVADRRAGQWIHYRLRRDLPAWVRQILRAAVAGAGADSPLADDARRLALLNKTPPDRARAARCG